MEGATRWLTYDDMATALGITPDSARRLATRHKWPRRPGNDGRALVAVPEERLLQAEATGAQAAPEEPEDEPEAGRDARALIGYLERRVGELADELSDARRIGEELRAEVREVRREADALRVAAAQTDALTALVAAERAHLGEVRLDRERLVGLLAERRVPWYERLAVRLARAG